MKRRDFLKASAWVGLTGALEPALSGKASAGENNAQDAQKSVENTAVSSPKAVAPDNRSADYLKRARADKYQPKAPAMARAYSFEPMPLAERIKRKVVPQRGFCSVAPGANVAEALMTGNGSMKIELMGEPYSEQILFHHEDLVMPWKRPMEAPKIAELFPQLRQMVLEGKHRDALTLAVARMNESGIKQDTEPHRIIPAFLMQLEMPKSASAKNYLRTVNFENSEVKVVWTDEKGEWTRSAFASRPDNAIVQLITPPAGQTLNLRISLKKSAEWGLSSGVSWGGHPARGVSKGPEAGDVQIDAKADRIVYKCKMDPTVDNSGYAGVVRVVRTGGSAKVEQDAVVIENATSVMLIGRIEHFAEISQEKADALARAVEQIDPQYAAMLERHGKVQAEMLNRVTVDFGGAGQYGMSAEELLTDQRARGDYSPALLEKVFEMGRHWFIFTSGKHPNIPGEAPFTINMQAQGMEPNELRVGEEARPSGLGLFQMAGAAQGDLREGIEAYFDWIESLAADCRANAKNIFGFRGTSYPIFAQRAMGVKYYYTGTATFGALWPLWISAGGLAYRPFWDYYLTTGDTEFLRKRVVPGLKDLALFYEDFLTATDSSGNTMLVPSISPESTPTSSDPSGPALINSTMDIAVCREVLAHLIQACETLKIEPEGVSKWKAMLAKMPPYMLEQDGTLKEWAWGSLQERYANRHISHLYGAWPGDEFDPDRAPKLAKAALIADRRRTFDLMSSAVGGETLPAFARCHRALVGARLKDSVLVDVQLHQLLEQGYVSASLRSSRDPYGAPVTDAQSGIPALMMEMLMYSRPGMLELLPAIPPTLTKGSISGLRSRTFARINKLAWDLEAMSVELTIMSLSNQDIELVVRRGIDEISAPAGVLAGALNKGSAKIAIRLPEGKRVELKLKLSRRAPVDWTEGVV